MNSTKRINYKKIISQLKEVIIQVDLEGKIQFVNQAWTEFTSYEQKDTLYRSIFYFLREDYIVGFYSSFQSGLKYIRKEVCLLSKDGEDLWFDINLTKYELEDEPGEFIYVGSLWNITKRKTSEQELQSAKKKLQTTLESERALTEEYQVLNEQLTKREKSIDAILKGVSASFGEDYFYSVNEHICQVIGADTCFIGAVAPSKESIYTIGVWRDGKRGNNFEYSLQHSPCENVVGFNICCYPNNVSELFPNDVALKQHGIEGYIGVPLFNKNGNPIGVMVALFKNRIADEEYAKAILAIFSSRTSAELERVMTEKDLVNNESKFRTLIESLDGTFYVFNTFTRRVEYISQQFEKVYGLTKQEFFEDPNIIFSRIHKDEREKVKERFRQAMFEGVPFRSTYKYINPRLNSLKWLKTNISFKENTQGELVAYCYVSDYTDSIMRQEALEEQNNALVKTNKELDRFVYSVSHDLRAPISSSLGLLQIIKSEKDAQEREKCLELQEKSLKKLDHFICDILDYSRNNRLEVNNSEVDWDELIGEIVQNHSHMDDIHKIDIRVKVRQDEKFFSDKRRLEIILNNLFSNAVRFYDGRKEKPFLNLSVKTTKGMALIKIQDNGIGIHPDRINKIFEMFYRATDHKPGSGIGLYIVHEAVNKLKGKIKVESVDREGTTFKIKLPSLYIASES